MPITPEQDDLFELRNLARPLGFWVGMHQRYDPVLGGGPFYVMRKKEFREQRNPSLLRYATKEDVQEFLYHSADYYAG